jgi:hypothetical protein
MSIRAEHARMAAIALCQVSSEAMNDPFLLATSEPT